MQQPTAPRPRTRRRNAVALLLAAFAVLAPGAAIAAPTVVDAAHSAPVSLLHGETTPPRGAGRPTVQLVIDELSRRRHLTQTGGLRVRRQLRRARRARSSSSMLPWIIDDKVRTALRTVLRRRGPPTAQLPIDGPWRADTTPRTCSPRAERLPLTLHAVTHDVHTSLRRGADTAQGASRDPGCRTEIGRRGPDPCTSRRRPE